MSTGKDECTKGKETNINSGQHELDENKITGKLCDEKGKEQHHELKSSIKNKMKRKLEDNESSDLLERNSEKKCQDSCKDNNEDDKMKIKVKPVNHFLAIRIKNPEIFTKDTNLQNFIKEKDPTFKSAFVQVPTLHITLNVLSLYSKEEKEKAIKALEASLESVEHLTQKFNLQTLVFSGLNNFNDEVLFVDTVENSCLEFLKELKLAFQKNFHSNNVNVKKEHSFKAHLTVMKLSKCVKIMKKNKIRKIPRTLYEEKKDDYFGDEAVSEISLCSMSDKKDDDGFYQVLATINLQEIKLYRNYPQATNDKCDTEDISDDY